MNLYTIFLHTTHLEQSLLMRHILYQAPQLPTPQLWLYEVTTFPAHLQWQLAKRLSSHLSDKMIVNLPIQCHYKNLYPHNPNALKDYYQMGITTLILCPVFQEKVLALKNLFLFLKNTYQFTLLIPVPSVQMHQVMEKIDSEEKHRALSKQHSWLIPYSFFIPYYWLAPQQFKRLNLS